MEKLKAMPQDLTDYLCELIARSHSRIPREVLETSRMSLFDWAACGLAGANEPVSRKVRRFLASEGSKPIASVIAGEPMSPRSAAMSNATTAHALDYDDTHFAHIGHLSVGIYSAALAAAEELALPLARAIDAFAIGAECAIAVGTTLGRDHYDRGFHQTATAGAFGATAAVARIYGLNDAEQRNALGLCATRASGLKNQFGTMGKPWNAGLAAATGVECAGLARAGLTSASDGLGGPHGFIATHSTGGESKVTGTGGYLLPDILYKFHACCHGTHAMLQALSQLPSYAPETIQQVIVKTHPRWLNVCDIKQPKTGLEVKFSYVWLAAMALAGRSTSRPDDYVDGLTTDPELDRLARRVEVQGDTALSDLEARVTVVYSKGETKDVTYDLASRKPQAETLKSLRSKGIALVGERAEKLWTVIEQSQHRSASDVRELLREPLGKAV